MAERLSNIALDFCDLILDAMLNPEREGECLDAANRLLTKIRLYIRLSCDLHCISPGQFQLEQPPRREAQQQPP